MNQDRRNQIIDLVTQQRTVKNTELMERFGISIETVRRDLKHLEQQGYLKCVYGGAVLNSSLGNEPEYAQRVKNRFREKTAIAAAAARLVKPGDSVYLGVGTTVESMAQYLKNFKELTVFTNALRTAIALSECSGCSVFLSGGQLRAKELTLSGFPSEENFDHFNVDKAFVGIGGIAGDHVTDFHLGEARLHNRLIQNARQAIVLADSGKLGVRAMTNICTLKDIDIVITDSGATKQQIRELEQAGVQVIVAEI